MALVTSTSPRLWKASLVGAPGRPSRPNSHHGPKPYPKPWQWWVLSCFGGAKPFKRFFKHQGKGGREESLGRFGRVRLASSPITEFLVDADSHSIAEIQQAVSCLKEMYGEVHTSVFAEPGRAKNRKWSELLSQPGITFRPVLRSSDCSTEPNDEAIQCAMQELSTRRGVHRIALLTGDADFISTILTLEATVSKYLVLVPEYSSSVVAAYQENGLEVLKLEDARKDRGSRVRAILHADGTGSVQLVDRQRLVEGDLYEQRSERVTCFLDNLGYKGHIGPASVKFWYENGLGDLAVFPIQLSMLAVNDVIQKSKSSTSWKKSSGQLAFFIPHGPLGNNHEKTRQTFGSRHAKSIFRGGGPFVLKDSRDLALQAMRKLGYLDAQNADEYEAMLCFVNVPNNKSRLRKLDLLPQHSDCSRDVKEKLRAAFQKDAHPTWWQRQTTPAVQAKKIVNLLNKNGFLSKKEEPAGQYCSGYSQNEISRAMKIFAREQLPACKTFNCLAWRIVGRIHSEDPKRRSTVEFRR